MRSKNEITSPSAIPAAPAFAWSYVGLERCGPGGLGWGELDHALRCGGATGKYGDVFLSSSVSSVNSVVNAWVG